MSVKFFGQFLVERGEIDAGELRQALDLMDVENPALGEIARRRGFFSDADAERINRAQHRTDRPFGDLAVDLGLLGREQLEEVVRAQREERLLLGEALVRLGSLNAPRLPLLLDAFKIDQAPYEAGELELPPELEGNPVASVILALFPKLCMRVARVRVKLGHRQPLSKLASLDLRVGVEIEGPPGLAITVVCDRDFAAHIVSGMSQIPRHELDADIVPDGLGEFINILAGTTVSILEREGTVTSLSPPRGDRFVANGIAFELAVGEGLAALVLATR